MRFFSENYSSDTGQRPRWRHYIFLLLIFVLTRALVLLCFEFRGTGILLTDARNYLDLARALQENHFLLPSSGALARHFPGLPLLIALLNNFMHNIILSGFIVSWFGALGSVFLFLYIFRDFRLAAVYTVFTPQWIGYSTSVASEGLSIFFYLLGLYAAFLRQRGSFFRGLLLFISGFAMVVRPMAFFVIYPFFIFTRLKQKRYRELCVELALITAVPIMYLCWNYISTQNIFPFFSAQAKEFSRASYAYGYASGRMFNLPLYALLAGFWHSAVPLLKKAHVALYIVLVFVAIRNLVRDKHTQKQDFWTPPFLISSLVYLLFISCVGGLFGFICFERYLVQINPLIVYALFSRRPLKWAWIVVLAVCAVLMASLVGRGMQIGSKYSGAGQFLSNLVSCHSAGL